MQKLTILVDMDDVLERLVDAWCEALNQRHGTSVRSEDIDDWDIAKFFPKLSREEVFAPLSDADFWSTVQPMENAQDVLHCLKNEGHTIKIVTAAAPSTVFPKMEWLFKNYPYLRGKDIVITGDKSVVKGDIMIDDGIHNLDSTTCYKVLFTRPHNAAYDAIANGMYRVSNWDEIYTLIQYMTGGTDD